MGEVWVATHIADTWQAAANGRPDPVWFALVRAEEIRSVHLETRDGIGESVVALVHGKGLSGHGSTTLVSQHLPGAERVSPLPALFHLDLIPALHRARALDEDKPMYVRAECEEDEWLWRVSTYEQLHARISIANMEAAVDGRL